MHNLALRRDLLPWIEALEEKIWMGRRALLTLKAIEGGTDHEAALKGMEALMHETQRNPKRIGGSSLLTLATYARRRARGTSRAVTAESMPFPRPTPGSADRTPAAPISAAEMDTDEQLSGQVEGNVIAFPDPSALDGMGHAMGSG